MDSPEEPVGRRMARIMTVLHVSDDWMDTREISRVLNITPWEIAGQLRGGSPYIDMRKEKVGGQSVTSYRLNAEGHTYCETHGGEFATRSILKCYGQTMNIADWSRRTGLPYSVVYGRIRRGWPVEKALSTPRIESQVRKPVNKRKQGNE